MSDTNHPLSEDQLKLISGETERAVSKALSRYVRAALIGYVILVAGIVYVFHVNTRDSEASRQALVQSGNAIAVDGCNNRFVDRTQLRAVFQRLIVASGVSYRNGNTTKTQYDAAIKFYEAQLKKLPLPDCRKSAHLLTDNPDAPVRVPVPLHP